MEIENSVEAIRDLTTASSEVRGISDVHSYVIVPKGYDIHSLEHLKHAPNRITASPCFESLDSFVAYVKKHKDADSVIFLNTDGHATAILDYHGEEEPRWGSHKASFTPRRSERWEAWQGATKRCFTQRELSEFIEDNISDFFTPTGGDMLTTAKTLAIKKDVRFKSDIRLENGDVSLEYEEVTKSGRGDIDIPSEFTIQIPVLEAQVPEPIAMRLRYKLDEGKVTFSIAMVRQQAILDGVKRFIYAMIKNDTGIMPFLGKP